ncbi:MAG: sigma 54-interacting transcriptional regulator [Myxococcales bacterium]|nr:sigma 54-interacting transcriptional regulator [Myxococcales bacterium]
MTGQEVDARALPLTGRVMIGRAADADVHVEHASVSRNHVVLELREDGITAIDQGGANGTTLRGVRLPAGVPVEIAPNEALGAGDLVLVVQELRGLLAGPAAPVRPSGAVAPSGHAPIVLDPAMRRLYELAARLARGTISTLIIGETGTGKEVLAEYVHRASPRADGPLIRVNCAAFAEGLFESELFGHERGAFTGAVRDHQGLLEAAAGGTVVLDEVGELPPAFQAKLLRVLEDRRVVRVGATTPIAVDVRFVAATNRDLEAAVADGGFRRDLYFRLAGAVLAVPPLRERPDEIVALAHAFLADAGRRLARPGLGLDDAALPALRRHLWPGNVRELKNVIERAALVADGDRITVAELGLTGAGSTAAPAAARAPADVPLADALATVERDRIVAALAQCQGNQTQAATLLGMPRRTFVKRLDQYGLARPRKR